MARNEQDLILAKEPWTQQSDLPHTLGTLSDFGYSVALSADGNTALVGARGWNGATGKVLVYTRSGSTWTQQADLPHALGTNSAFGHSVSLSADGNTALVGASAWNSNTGKALIYTRSGSTWTQKADLPHALGASYFGYSLALSADGNTALVGAIGWNSVTGKVLVYTRNGGTWTLQADLPHELGPGSGFGYSVALSADGNTALVGAYYWNSGTGKALIYTRSGSTWTHQADLPHALGQNSYFGNSIALSDDGNTALVGAYGWNSATGKVLVYTRSGGTWTQQADLPHPLESSYFCYPVSLSADGNTALVGAPGWNSGTGKALVYTRIDGVWFLRREFTGVAFSHLGWSVSLSGDGSQAVIGAPGLSSSTGKAVFYQ